MRRSGTFAFMSRQRRHARSLRYIAPLLLIAAACAHNPERLPLVDRQFYYNLESDADRDAFLRLKESERQAFLEKRGLWAKWTALSEEEKKAVNSQDIEVGYQVFAAHMAWGPPADRRTEDARDRSVDFETYIRCTSGPKVGRYVHNNVDCDGTSSEVRLGVEKGIITEIKYLD